MYPLLIAGIAIIATSLAIYLYISHNDKLLMQLPQRAAKFSPNRFTDQQVTETFKRLRSRPVDVRQALGERTGRRYIVTGGVCGYAEFLISLF